MDECRMWFGTKDYMTWITTPLSGADSSPAAWGASGTLITGEGYARSSFNSHKRYSYSWPESSTREEAQLMKSFFDGSFGRGHIQFVEPTIYDINVLPAKWASPSITCNYEGQSLIPDLNPFSVSQSNFAPLRLPVSAAQYMLDRQVQGSPERDGLFVPIPDGYALMIHCFGSITSDDAAPPAIWVANVARGGSVVSPVKLEPISPDQKRLKSDGVIKISSPSGFVGAQVWIGGESAGDVTTGIVTIGAMHAELVEESLLDAWLPLPYEGWLGGQGHSGVRFEKPPTYVTNNGVDGGQVEYAATFVESVI